MRRDARERRERLLAAAAECFARDGFDVPLEVIAEKAGVGRGTLYRNFADRLALTLAIFETAIEEGEAALRPEMSLAEVLVTMMRTGAKASALYARIAMDLPRDGENVAAFEALGDRVVAMLQPYVDRAQAEGSLRRDLGADQVFLVLCMLGGLVSPHLSEAAVDQRIRHAVELIQMGLLPR